MKQKRLPVSRLSARSRKHRLLHIFDPLCTSVLTLKCSSFQKQHLEVCVLYPQGFAVFQSIILSSGEEEG